MAQDVTNKQNESFAEVVKQPIRCTPEDFPSLYETWKRKKTFPEINKSTPYIFETVHKDNSGNGVCLFPNDGRTFLKRIHVRLLRRRHTVRILEVRPSFIQYFVVRPKLKFLAYSTFYCRWSSSNGSVYIVTVTERDLSKVYCHETR